MARPMTNKALDRLSAPTELTAEQRKNIQQMIDTMRKNGESPRLIAAWELRLKNAK